MTLQELKANVLRTCLDDAIVLRLGVDFLPNGEDKDKLTALLNAIDKELERQYSEVVK